MKKIEKTLYVTTDNTYLHCQKDAIAIVIDKEEKMRLPANSVEYIICLGNTTISSPFIKFCGEHHIQLSFLSPYGNFYGRINGPTTGNVLVRKKQYELLVKNEQVPIGKNIILGKAINSKNVLKRGLRDTLNENDKEKFTNAINIIDNNIDLLKTANNIDEIRGYEGVIANSYFGCMDLMIKNKDFIFEKRTRRPAENEFNALLSFMYIMLEKHIESACESYSLDPNCGIIHGIKPGKPSLALDLMEEFRAPLVDRFCLALVNKRQISLKDFENTQGEIIIKPKTIKTILSNWEARKKEEITHPYLNEKMPIALVAYSQAQLMAQLFRGDIKEYPPFIWR